MDGKKTEAFTVKVSDEMARFVEVRAKQRGFESASEFIRSLLESEHQQALSDFKLLTMALGIKGTNDSLGNGNLCAVAHGQEMFKKGMP